MRRVAWESFKEKKGGNGSDDGSKVVSITEAGKHEHKGKRPAKEFLERVDTKMV